MFSDGQLAEIFGRTTGHCHFCGDPLVLGRYGEVEGSPGGWEIDHVIQKGKGGARDITNCLAACVKCNRLRWDRTGQEVRDLLLYGLIVKDEVKKKTKIGKLMEELKRKRVQANLKRRRKIGESRDGEPPVQADAQDGAP